MLILNIILIIHLQYIYTANFVVLQFSKVLIWPRVVI